MPASVHRTVILAAGRYGGMLILNNSYGFAVDYEINNDLLYRFLYEGASSEELLAE